VSRLVFQAVFSATLLHKNYFSRPGAGRVGRALPDSIVRCSVIAMACLTGLVNRPRSRTLLSMQLNSWNPAAVRAGWARFDSEKQWVTRNSGGAVARCFCVCEDLAVLCRPQNFSAVPRHDLDAKYSVIKSIPE